MEVYRISLEFLNNRKTYILWTRLVECLGKGEVSGYGRVLRDRRRRRGRRWLNHGKEEKEKAAFATEAVSLFGKYQLVSAQRSTSMSFQTSFPLRVTDACIDDCGIWTNTRKVLFAFAQL